MDATDLVDAVREENKTELSRLGSSKSLYADTEGEMEPDAVLTAAADMASHGAETFDGWATDEDVAGVFAGVADAEQERYEAIADELDAHDPGEAPALVDFLRGLEGPTDRLGGLVGWSFVLEEKASQSSGFFTGQADPGTASLFRGFGDEYEDARQEALDALVEICEDTDDWDQAEAAATGAIGAAYEAYVETLETLGVNPKPVC
jgi:hypothetical protein